MSALRKAIVQYTGDLYSLMNGRFSGFLSSSDSLGLFASSEKNHPAVGFDSVIVAFRVHAISVIDDAMFARLQTLYDQRNRVVHRYVISRITTSDVLNIAIEYEEIISALSKRIYEIEEQQIKEGIGITVRGPALEGEEGKRFLEEIADEKHTQALAKLLHRK